MLAVLYHQSLAGVCMESFAIVVLIITRSDLAFEYCRDDRNNSFRSHESENDRFIS